MKAGLDLALRTLLVARLHSADVSSDSCLARGYFGTYGAQSVIIPDEDCLFSELNAAKLDAGSLAITPKDTVELVWVQQQAVDESLAERYKELWSTGKHWKAMDDALRDAYSQFQDHLEAAYSTENDQVVLYPDPVSDDEDLVDCSGDFEILYRTPSSSLFAFSNIPSYRLQFDTHLPQYFKAYVIPESPVAPAVPVPKDSVKRVRNLLKHLKHDKTVAHIVNNISVPQMNNDVTWLTGEDERSGIISRHSFSQGARVAAQWILERIEETGAQCELRTFLYGFAPNVICRYPSTVETTGTVIFSAHYDSRGSFGSSRAPGGDDDGSGTTAILSIARTIGRLDITFRSNVELVLFAGEEQGLYGSRAYSRDLRQVDANITLMIQADMLAYHKSGEEPQLGLPDIIGTQEVTQLVANISGLYSPELKVGFTPACCSDHQSFHEQGFPASQVFERAGPIADPMYHNSGDLSQREGYDLEQLKSIAKVQFATLLHAAGFDIPA